MDLSPEEKRVRRNAYMREYYRKWRETHGVSRTVAWRRENPDAAEAHRDRERQRWYNDPTIRERHRDTTKRERQRVKDEVFAAYGGYRCACCPETEPLFMSLDHIHNDGAAERKRLGHGGSGIAFYRSLQRLGYPPGYQVLCMNCNFGKRMNGGVCPHKKCSG